MVVEFAHLTFPPLVSFSMRSTSFRGELRRGGLKVILVCIVVYIPSIWHNSQFNDDEDTPWWLIGTAHNAERRAILPGGDPHPFGVWWAAKNTLPGLRPASEIMLAGTQSPLGRRDAQSGRGGRGICEAPGLGTEAMAPAKDILAVQSICCLFRCISRRVQPLHGGGLWPVGDGVTARFRPRDATMAASARGRGWMSGHAIAFVDTPASPGSWAALHLPTFVGFPAAVSQGRPLAGLERGA